MIPVMQTVLYQDKPRVYGDCMRASIASLLDLPIEDVPHFLQLAEGHVVEFYDLIEEFLEARGISVLWQHELAYHWREGDPSVYHLMSGPSPRHAGVSHCIVGRNGHPYFDPHPDQTMLAGTPDQWTSSFLIKATS